MAYGRLWTPEEEAELIELWRSGNITRLAMSQMLGRSFSAVCRKLTELRPVLGPPRATMRGRLQTHMIGPPPRRNDCAKHLKLIAKANGGKDFPVLDLPARVRIAA